MTAAARTTEQRIDRIRRRLVNGQAGFDAGDVQALLVEYDRLTTDRNSLAEHVASLNVALAIWAGRDDSVPQPEVRSAATRAVGDIDAAMRELHRLRIELVTQVRRSDDATLARAKALLDCGLAASIGEGREAQ